MAPDLQTGLLWGGGSDIDWPSGAGRCLVQSGDWGLGGLDLPLLCWGHQVAVGTGGTRVAVERALVQTPKMGIRSPPQPLLSPAVPEEVPGSSPRFPYQDVVRAVVRRQGSPAGATEPWACSRGTPHAGPCPQWVCSGANGLLNAEDPSSGGIAVELRLTQAWVAVLALPLSSPGTLGKLISLARPRFPPL